MDLIQRQSVVGLFYVEELNSVPRSLLQQGHVLLARFLDACPIELFIFGFVGVEPLLHELFLDVFELLHDVFVDDHPHAHKSFLFERTTHLRLKGTRLVQLLKQSSLTRWGLN